MKKRKDLHRGPTDHGLAHIRYWHFMEVINRLVEAGNTVVVIEHNLHVIKNADWIIDMGPEGGSKGGAIMFEGTPKELLNAKKLLTAESTDGCEAGATLGLLRSLLMLLQSDSVTPFASKPYLASLIS